MLVFLGILIPPFGSNDIHLRRERAHSHTYPVQASSTIIPLCRRKKKRFSVVFLRFYAIVVFCIVFPDTERIFWGFSFMVCKKEGSGKNRMPQNSTGGKIPPAELPSSAYDTPENPKWEKPPNQLHKTTKKSTVSLLHFPHRM
ncbi:MAG: hypothetical protein IJB52_00055 [Clostridia bacterium]|nr:hypothetical protein [Clostridia bacterium]